ETFLRSLQKRAPDTRVIYTEPGRRGFQLRHEPGGALAFWLRYQVDGKTAFLPLGHYPETGLDAAHEAHGQARAQLRQGLDPVAEHAAAARARRVHVERERDADAVTIRNVVAEWGWHHARHGRKQPREAVRLARVYLVG